MKRPLFIFLLFLIEGILLGRYLKLNIIFLFILMLNILLVFYIYKIYKLKIVYIFIFSFLLGYFSLKNTYFYKNNTLNFYINSGEIFTLNCIVKNINYTSECKQRVVFKVNKLYLKRKEFNNKFCIQAILEEKERVNLGQKVKLKGKILPLIHKKNPQDFDEFLYLKARNIEYKMFPEIIKKYEVKNNIYVILNKVKIKFIDIYDNILPSKESSIVKSMILGDKSNLDRNIFDLYKSSGIYHILVISGLHITIVVMFLTLILENIFNVKLSYILTMIFIILYCIIVGNGVSTIRAVIMSCTLLFGKLIYREVDVITSISFAAICILLYNPVYLFDIGFLFSFIIVFSLSFCSNSIDNLYGILFKKVDILNFLLSKDKIRNIISTSTVVSLYLSPILSYYFFYINPYSLIINLIIVPTSGIIVISSFLLGLIGIININIAKILSYFLIFLLNLDEFICKFFINLPFSNILLGRVNFIFIIIFYLIISFILYVFSDNINNFNRNKKYIYTIIILYFSTILCCNVFNNNMEVTFLDVKGESAVITIKNKAYIINGSGSLDIYDKVLKDFLNYKGINKVDTIFITNVEKEHILGIIKLANLKKVKKVVLPYNINTKDKIYINLKDKFKNNNIQLEFVDSNYKLNLNKNIFIDVIYPIKKCNKNNNSNMVLKLTYKDIKFLFANSIKEEDKNIILKNNKDISASVLNLSFSKNLVENNLLEEVNPIIVIFNQKYNKIYNLDEDFYNYFKDIDIYNIKKDNAIVIKTNGKKISLFKMNEGD